MATGSVVRVIVKLTRRIMGSRDYHALPEYADDAARLLVGCGADHRNLKRSKDGLSFTLSLFDGAAFERLCMNHGIKLTIVRERGVIQLVGRYKRRIGIPVGIVLFLTVLFISEKFIWDVRVVGNETVPSESIISELAELGCGVGTYIPSIDFDLLHNEYLLRDDKLSWISVNVRGTVATVEVRELEVPEIKVSEDSPCNLVASEDGLITEVEVLRGSPVVTNGVLVKKGELLASGVQDMKHGIRLTNAEGRVMAEVRREINVEVPLETTAISATGREFSEKYFNFFGITVKFFENTENMGAEYDKIDREYPLHFFFLGEVPISVTETVYREYEHIPVSYTEKEARAEAYRRLRELCDEVLADCELLSRQMSASLEGGAFKINCELTVLKDIAEKSPIYEDK